MAVLTVNCLLLRRGAGIDHGAVPAIFHDAAFNCDAQRVTDRIKPCAEESLAEMDQYEFGSGYGHGKQREFVREYWDQFQAKQTAAAGANR